MDLNLNILAMFSLRGGEEDNGGLASPLLTFMTDNYREVSTQREIGPSAVTVSGAELEVYAVVLEEKVKSEKE